MMSSHLEYDDCIKQKDCANEAKKFSSKDEHSYSVVSWRNF